LLSGLAADTPVAIIQNASLPSQREALTTLGRLAATVAEEGLQSPSVIVVGHVVQGAVAWTSAFENHLETSDRVLTRAA